MIRLDRWLVHLGLGSRSQVQPLIRGGAVRVDGETVRDPGRACDPASALEVQGKPVDGRLTRHVMLHKPVGVLTAARDPKQPTVMDLLPAWAVPLGCMPVGRLDKDTSGLLLLTTDGALAHSLLAPGRHVDKTYEAELDAPLPGDAAEAFARGLDLGDFTAQPAQLEILGKTAARVTVHEGKFHQVRRMFEAIGCTVTVLHRERFGPLTLDAALAPGEWRELTPEETAALYAVIRRGTERA
ncbi:MAG: rRNA pseudouridine synthase [Clostridia bacterium]|nr:rRNA pseudouridine synthase [Clostridia bacterium]